MPNERVKTRWKASSGHLAWHPLEQQSKAGTAGLPSSVARAQRIPEGSPIYSPAGFSLPMLAAIEIRDVACSFGAVRALDGVSLDVAAETVTGIVGPNDAGKTTLIDVLCGLVRPSCGSVRIFGQDVRSGARAIRARIGVLPQETALYDEVTAAENLRFAARQKSARPSPLTSRMYPVPE
jgi:ABC-type multidrug transport system fused ATPase/permease subunit